MKKSAGKTGSCFPDEGTGRTGRRPQCVFRIPLPHMGSGDILLSVRRSEFGLPDQRRRFFS